MRCRRVSAAPLTPVAAEWAAIERLNMAMMQTPIAMQPTQYIQNSWADKPYGRITPLEIAAVHDGSTLAVRIAWSALGGGNTDFPDAVAMAMPLIGEAPLITMGTPDEPIHILHWKAQSARKPDLRSIVARGIGTSAPGPELRSQASGVKDGNQIAVVIARAIGRKSGGALVLPGKSVKLGFAVWDGGNEERAGIKAISEDWIDVALDA